MLSHTLEVASVWGALCFACYQVALLGESSHWAQPIWCLIARGSPRRLSNLGSYEPGQSWSQVYRAVRFLLLQTSQSLHPPRVGDQTLLMKNLEARVGLIWSAYIKPTDLLYTTRFPSPLGL